MTGIARLYGGSLYELAAEEQLSDIIKEELEQIRKLFWENPDYSRLLSEPSIPLETRLGLIDQAFGEGAQRYVVNFMKLLCEKGLLREFAGSCDEFTRRYHEDHNIAVATVTSAVPLNENQLSALKEKLEKISQKRVSLITKTDSSVVAGLRVEFEGKQLDGTVAGRIAGISRKLEETLV
ncbi:MAG: ATP synthase F1 subunit delta [Blautia sp.]|nr:ATP synthase F1 subunit delta [Blautia sp.]